MSLSKLAPAVVVASALALSSSSALAQEAPDAKPRFGDANQVALSINQDLAQSITDLTLGTGVQVSYFVARHVSLGLDAGIGWSSLSGSSTTNGTETGLALRVGPRVGYDVPLSDLVSIWPQIGVEYRRYEQDVVGDLLATTSTTNQLSFVAVAPILIHPTRGFFVGAGPSFSTDLSNSTSLSSSTLSTDNPKLTSLGLMATIGGAF